MALIERSEANIRLPVSVAIASVVFLILSGILFVLSPSSGTEIIFALAQITAISIVIWQTCDPFADAAQWLGERFHIPGSVRGATLDAIASSLPELFSGIFFVVIAIEATDGSAEQMKFAGSEGYGATVATCAGSAVYNMVLIPAICALVISYCRKSHPTIEVEPAVILRDGMWFLGCEVVLIIFLYQTELHWWMAAILLVMYAAYVVHLAMDARRFRFARKLVSSRVKEMSSTDTEAIADVLSESGIRPSLAMLDQVRREMTDGDEGDEHEADTAGILFSKFQIRLNLARSLWIILICTLIAAAACYWLVEVTRLTASTLDIPIFFIAVIVAAAASSVPDTFLSIAAARRGDDDGAVSNAFGSNIFDICVCLAIPLLINAYLSDWEPVLLTENGEPLRGLFGLRILLFVLTLITLGIMWHKRQLTRLKAWVLVALYGVFVAYAVFGALNLGGF
jgi:cation:H+ antiporter